MLMKNPFCCVKNITIEHFIVYLFYVYGKYTIQCHDILIKKNHIVKLKSSASESGEDYPCYNSNKNNNKKNNKNPHQNLT